MKTLLFVILNTDNFLRNPLKNSFHQALEAVYGWTMVIAPIIIAGAIIYSVFKMLQAKRQRKCGDIEHSEATMYQAKEMFKYTLMGIATVFFGFVLKTGNEWLLFHDYGTISLLVNVVVLTTIGFYLIQRNYFYDKQRFSIKRWANGFIADIRQNTPDGINTKDDARIFCNQLFVRLIILWTAFLILQCSFADIIALQSNGQPDFYGELTKWLIIGVPILFGIVTWRTARRFKHVN